MKELILGSQVFEKAVEWKKYQGDNPFLKTRYKIKKGKKPGALTPEEVLSIRDQIEHPVKRDMVGFASYTGWRIGEIRKLKWKDIQMPLWYAEAAGRTARKEALNRIPSLDSVVSDGRNKEENKKVVSLTNRIS